MWYGNCIVVWMFSKSHKLFKHYHWQRINRSKSKSTTLQNLHDNLFRGWCDVNLSESIRWLFIYLSIVRCVHAVFVDVFSHHAFAIGSVQMSVNEASTRGNKNTQKAFKHTNKIAFVHSPNLIGCLSDLLLIKVNGCFCIAFNGHSRRRKKQFFDWIPLKLALIITSTHNSAE